MRAIINSDYRTHFAPFFWKLGILDISQVNVFEVAKFMFDYRNNLLLPLLLNLFVTNSHIHQNRTVIIERFCTVQISSNLQFSIKVLKFGTLFLFQSFVRQTFLPLRRKCKSFYLNNHWLGLTAHSQHFFFTLFINVGEVSPPSSFNRFK